MKVVITGATGFIGGAIANRLTAQGASVTALVRPSSDRWRLDDTPVNYVLGDIADPASLESLFTDADQVIHAAGRLGESGVSQAIYDAAHVDGVRHVLQAVQDQAPNATVLHVGTPGIVGPIPTPTSPLPTEKSPLNPTNPYERSKAKGEAVVMAFAEAGLDVRVMRPEFVFGPRDFHVIGLFQAIKRGIFFYIGNGKNVSHPSYIDDVVDGALAILERGERGDVFNISGERPISWREFGGEVARVLEVRPPFIRLPYPLVMGGAIVGERLGGLLGVKPPLSVTGVKFFSENRAVGWQKAGKKLGYRPKHSFAEGVQKTIAWYQDAGYL